MSILENLVSILVSMKIGRDRVRLLTMILVTGLEMFLVGMLPCIPGLKGSLMFCYRSFHLNNLFRMFDKYYKVREVRCLILQLSF